MVNTLSGSVCAYRKGTVKPRFIRIDEVKARLIKNQAERQRGGREARQEIMMF